MHADELRRLRARAYGPDADIVSDPGALARLEELEAELRVRDAPEAEVPKPLRDEPVTGSDDLVAPADAVDEDEQDDPQAEEPAEVAAPPAKGVRGWRTWSRRRTAIVGAIALVVTVVVAVGATSFVTRRAGYAAPVEAVLVVSPGREVPEMFGAPDGEARVFADYGGLTPITMDTGWSTPMNGECLMVVESEHIDTATPNTFSGVWLSGCGAGPFPATISLLVGPSMPEALREQHPDGSAVQFVLEDDEVVVLTAPPDESATPAPED